MDRPIAVLKSSMSTDEVQIALSPSVGGEVVIVPKIESEEGLSSFLDCDLILDCSDLTVVAYFNISRFITVGVLYNGCPIAWNKLEDKTRMRIRKAARKRNIPTETLHYWDSRYYILEGLEVG